MHGKASRIAHDGRGRLRRAPGSARGGATTRCGRGGDLPDALVVTARSEDGEIMALRHREQPLVGVQFHPESVLTHHGHELLRAFLAGVPGVPRQSCWGARRRSGDRRASRRRARPPRPAATPPRPRSGAARARSLSVMPPALWVVRLDLHPRVRRADVRVVPGDLGQVADGGDRPSARPSSRRCGSAVGWRRPQAPAGQVARQEPSPTSAAL